MSGEMETNLSTNRVGLIARDADDPDWTDCRTEAPLRVAASVTQRGYNDATATVQVFRSAEEMDRAGVVIRIGLRFGNGHGFKPWARLVESGVELHIAGENEAAAVMDALRVALALPHDGRTTVENQKGAPRCPADPPWRGPLTPTDEPR